MPQRGHKDNERIKTFPSPKSLQSLEFCSRRVWSSQVAAMSAFLSCVLTQKPIEPTEKCSRDALYALLCYQFAIIDVQNALEKFG